MMRKRSIPYCCQKIAGINMAIVCWHTKLTLSDRAKTTCWE